MRNGPNGRFICGRSTASAGNLINKMGIGRTGRLPKVCILEVGPFRLPKKAKQRGPRHREVHIAKARRDQLRGGIRLGHRFPGGLGGQELAKPFGR